jgi:hypothetical protein
MNEIYKVKLREANSSIARSSIKPIISRISERLVFLPGFLIFIQSITLLFILNSFSFNSVWPAIFDRDYFIKDRLLQIQNYITHIYFPIVVICFVLISIGLIINLNKRCVNKLNVPQQYFINDTSKRRLVLKYKERGYLFERSSTHSPSKLRFNIKHVPIVVFLLFTIILFITTNTLGFDSDITLNFIIHNYVPVVIICWITDTLLFMISHLRKKLKDIKIKRYPEV